MENLIDLYQKTKETVLDASREIKDKIVKELPEDYVKKMENEGIKFTFANLPLLLAEAAIYIYEQKKEEKLF